MELTGSLGDNLQTVRSYFSGNCDRNDLISAMENSIVLAQNEPLNCTKLAETLQTLKEVIVYLMDTVEKDECRIKELKMKLEQLEIAKDLLLLGEIAIQTDRALVESVLKGVSYIPAIEHLTINKVEKAIKYKNVTTSTNIFLTEGDKEVAAENLSRLTHKFKLQAKHYVGLSHFRRIRNTVAHPPIKISKAKNLLKAANIKESDKELCLELIEIFKEL